MNTINDLITITRIDFINIILRKTNNVSNAREVLSCSQRKMQ